MRMHLGKHWTPHHTAIFGADHPPTIRLGSSGTVVKEWQNILGMAQTGNFDKETQGRTKDWQTQHPPLKPDGVVGPKTWTMAQQVTPQVPTTSDGSTPAPQVVETTGTATPDSPSVAVQSAGKKGKKITTTVTQSVEVAEKGTKRLWPWAAIVGVVGAIFYGTTRKA